MRTQCRRICERMACCMRSTPVFRCTGICNGRCQSRVQSPESRGREGLLTLVGLNSPSLNDLHLEVWSVLKGGVDSLGHNDFGRPWPAPRGEAIARALMEHDPDLVRIAARETREIVQSQDRAPNITGLFEKKLRERVEVRAKVRQSLAGVSP